MLSLPASAAEIAEILMNKIKNNESNKIFFEFFIAFTLIAYNINF